MATPEKRVQVLFDPEQYALVEAQARTNSMSVGALIREAVDEYLKRWRFESTRTLREMFKRADETPIVDPVSVEEWYRAYDDELARTELP